MLNPAMRTSLKIVESLGIALGPAIIVLNLFSYKVAKSGTPYYLNGQEWGIAIGAFLIGLAIVSRKWQRQ